jgi:hypothetical protein
MKKILSAKTQVLEVLTFTTNLDFELYKII